MRAFGKYRLVEPLASGGMADVWRAETTGAAGVVKEVALKLVRGEHEARSDFVRMFIEEARLASRLRHANVVQVLEFDQVEGRYYIAMELVHGRDLAQVVERARALGVRLGLARAVHVGAEVARALAYAHRLAEGGRPLGLVHRDVSPHNVLVSFEGEVKLADFGIARAMSRAGVTDPGTVKGKLAYMAPEQVRGDAAVDARADVFALGVVLWELCAGRRLFARDGDAATLAAVLDPAPVSPPSAWNEEVPPELDRAILGALERDPARRTAGAQELATALGSVLLALARSPDDFDLRALMHRLWPEGAAPAPATLERTAVRAPPREGGEAEEPTRTAQGRGPPRRGRGRWIAAGVGAIAAAAVTVVGARWMGPGSTPTSTANSSPTSTPTSTSTATPTATPTPTPTANSTPNSSPPPDAPSSAAPSAPLEVLTPQPPRRGALPVDPSRPGNLLVTSSSGWAFVDVDGRRVGETPLNLALPAGRYRVRVSQRGNARAHEAWVEIAPGRATRFSARPPR